MENGHKRSSQGFDECDVSIFKRQKSVSDILPINSLHMSDNILHNKEVKEEEDECQEMVQEEEIHQTIRQDEKSHRFRNGLRKFRDDMFSFLNNIAEAIIQEPAPMKDIGASLHMKDDHGNPISVGIRLRPKGDDFEICDVGNDSVAKEKLRIGDRIVKVNEHCLLKKKIEDIYKIFMSKSLVITIKREVIVENETHTVEFKCKITYNGKVEMVFESLDKCGKYNLWSSGVQKQMCLFREEFKFGDEKREQYFVRCINTQVSAGKFDKITSSLDVNKLLLFSGMAPREVWILQHNNKFITVNTNKEIELTDGQEIGGFTVCDGRAFTYKTYPKSLDSYLFESLQNPGYYLAIDGDSVKLLKLENEDFTKVEGHKCQLEITSVKSVM